MSKTGNVNLYKSNKSDWQTPNDIIYDILDFLKIDKFNMDVCCDQFHIPAKYYITKSRVNVRKTISDDGRTVVKNHISNVDTFTTEWEGLCFMNPPFKFADKFVKRAIDQVQKNKCKVVALLPVRPETEYWHSCVFKHANMICFINQKINFNSRGRVIKGSGNPSPVCIVFFGFDIDLSNFKLRNYRYSLR